MWEHSTSRMIGGHESRGISYLGTNSSVSYVASSCPKLLHERIGHPHSSKVRKMVPDLNNLQTLECQSCQLKNMPDLLFLNILNIDVISILYLGFRV